MTGRVLVLRDREAAGETARELARRGFEALILPVQEIGPTEDAPPVARFAGIVVTSRNAVPALRRHLAGTSLPVLAVAAATAADLRSAGFAGVETGAGDAASLLAPATALARRAGGLPLLLALGRRRTSALEEGLGAAGIAFAVWEAYETRLLRPRAAEIETALGGRAPDAVLVLSEGQAEALAGLVAAAPDLFRPLPRLFCLSARIAAVLPAELRGLASISSTPALPALFDCIDATNFQPTYLAGCAGETRKTG